MCPTNTAALIPLSLAYRRRHCQRPPATAPLSTNPQLNWIKEQIEGFAHFKAELRKVFAPSNETNQAVRVIQYIKQKGSVAEYTTQFQQYVVKTKWDDDVLMIMYRRGLKENVKDGLMRSGASLDTLDELQKEAIQIDNNLFERYDRGVSGASIIRYQYGRGFNSNYGKRSIDPYGLMPMELNMIKKGRVRGKLIKGVNKKVLKYYSYNKLGHFARDYRLKNMVFRPQINIMQAIITKDKAEGISKSSPKQDDLELKMMLVNQGIYNNKEAIA